MSLRVLTVGDYVNDEFRRILGNPGNEIVSESLKDRLSYTDKSIDFSISFGSNNFECKLDSFSISSKDNKLSRVSLLINADIVSFILSLDTFVITCDSLGIAIDSSNIENIDCFKYNQDTYSLELSLVDKEILND